MTTKIAKRKTIKLFFKIILYIVFATFVTIAMFFIYEYKSINLNNDLLLEISTPVEIYGDDNTFIEENVQGIPYIKLSNLQKHTIDAFIAIEDTEFYRHNGINLKRILGATIKNISSFSFKEGASTITQQLIKNTHLSNSKTIDRKIKEIILALKLEKNYSKDEILEMYLNAIYFGNGCYGIESASQFYFNKSASNLDINESAVLAGLIKSPANYSPINNQDKIEKRKNLVLNEMNKQNLITDVELASNKTKGIILDINNMNFEKESAYINSALLEASEILNLPPNKITSSHFKIYTYHNNFISGELSNSIKHNSNAMHNAIVVDNKTGGIIAFNSSYIFGSTKIKRNPESTRKPSLVYAPALEYGEIYTCSLLNDEPTIYENNYKPKNISDIYYGKITAEEALAKSLNIPAINLFKEIGIEKCKSFAKKCGITFDKTDNGLSLALGAMKYGVTIQDLCNAYLTLPNNGYYKKTAFIKRIEDENGNIVYSRNGIQKKVFSDETAYLLGKMMEKTTTIGTCKALSSLPYEIHTKTGTNGTENENKNTDKICIAQTTEHTSCIWYFSKDNNEENLLDSNSGSQLSPTLKVKTLFENIYKNNAPKKFSKPNGIISLKLDVISFENNKIELASKQTPERYIFEKEFDMKNSPKVISTNFIKITPTVLNFQKIQSKIEFSFNTQRHQKYELIKEYKLNGKVIDEVLYVITNKNTQATYTDNSILDNIDYKYFVKIKNIANNQYEISNIIQV